MVHMKGIYFISIRMLFLVFLVTSSTAQIGVKVGLGFSDIAFKDEGQIPYLGYEINSIEHRLPLLTYQIGVFAPFEFSNRVGFQPELLFITQGLDYSTDYLFDDIKYKIRSSYVQLPLLFKYRSALKKNKLSGIVIGPYTSLKLNARRITEIEGQQEKVAMTNMRQFDFGVIAGYAFDFNLASRKVLLELRTSYSLVNMMDRIEGYAPSYYGPRNEYARNISITLSVQYLFSEIGKKKSLEQ